MWMTLWMRCSSREQNASELKGQAFNIGGGPRHTTSLLELIDLIGALEGEPVRVRFDDWRVGDQRYYVSDTRAFQNATGWKPRVSVREGVERLHRWLVDEDVASHARLNKATLQRGVA